MSNLLDRLPERISPKVVGVVVTTGFAAAGVVSLVARNLRTLADQDESLGGRLSAVTKESLGALMSGPAGLAARGRDVITGRTSGDQATTEPSADDGEVRSFPARPSSAPSAPEAESTDEPETDEPEATDEPKATEESEATDEHHDLDLRADLEAMTVSQLRERAAQDGVPGRSKMNKDDLIAALIEREPEKADA